MNRNILIVGAQRSGSSWLYELIKKCDSVLGINPESKEPRLLMDVSSSSEYHLKAADLMPSGCILLEKSVAYLEMPDIASRAKLLLPESIVIVILRDPVERAFSNWKFSVQNRFESRAFSECLTKEAESREWHGSVTSPFKYVSRGLYWQQLAPWLESFPNLIVLQFERIMATATRKREISELFKKLELTEPKNERLILAPLNQSLNQNRISRSVRKYLHDFYVAENSKLARLGVDINLWS
jgi:hypothetical protein